MTTNIWCTLVMLGDSYAAGAAVVARSLRNAKTEYPVWCMIDESVSEDCAEFLSGHFDNIVRVPLISHQCVNMKSKKQAAIYSKWINHSFTKFNVLNNELFPATNVIFVDADTMFLENCDELFDLPGNALCFSSAWAKPFVPGGIYNPYGVMKHGQIVNPKHIRSGMRSGFVGLACMMLLRPDAITYSTLLEILTRADTYGNSNCCSGFDEQLIAETLLEIGQPIYHIAPRYTCVAGKQGVWLSIMDKEKVVTWYNSKPFYENPATTQWPDDKIWWECAKCMIEEYPESRRWFYMSVKE